jgi:hypothetical protein
LRRQGYNQQQLLPVLPPVDQIPMFCTKEELLNESDVEHKFIWPLLTAALPNGLGYSSVDIRSKPDIRKLRIDKGKNNEKLYQRMSLLQLKRGRRFLEGLSRSLAVSVKSLRRDKTFQCFE